MDDIPDDSFCYAWDEEPDEDPPDPEGCCDPCGNSGASGNPVHLFSGEKVEVVVDISIPGRGFDFVLQRTYRSRAEAATFQGTNWDTSYNLWFEQVGDNFPFR